MKQNKKRADKASGEPCLIVGIGASAGGLNSLECFLKVLPDEFGFAIVFMQHLSPTHKSLLPDLLRTGRPDLDIIEITEGLPVLPGKIYLSQPRQDIKIQKGIFHAMPPEKHVHLLIDEFLIALAEEYGDKAVAVIFSGAGTDGSRGALEIRKKGGTVFVQDPSTAEFAEMPLSAIDGGQADKVLPAEDIAREILKLQCSVTAPANKTLIAPEDFETLYTLVREKTGYRFNHYKRSVVERRIRRRMSLHEIATVRDYLKIAAENDAEASSLAADLMIGVTSFFRDPLAWKALRIGVIRKLAAEDGEYPVRIWTPACATGEESYSVAMMLHNEFELAGRKREIQVFATDVNDKTLEKAREGKYPASIAADVPPDFMRRFFSIPEDGLSATVCKTIRDHVIFARQDLLADPPFSRLDLIICRNLLIYLEPDAQDKCLVIFHYALRDGGYLFLGNAESVGRENNLFKSLSHKKCRIYSKLANPLSSRVQSVPFAAERGTARISKEPLLPAKRQPSDADLVQGALIEEYAPAAVAINQNYDIIYHNGPTNRYLQHPRGAPTQNLLELLPENLRNRIRGAVYRASREARPVSIRADCPGVDPASKEKRKRCTYRISKLGEGLFLIVFIEKGGPKFADAIAPEPSPVDESVVLQLENELSSTRTDLQTNIEQLKSANEELQSSNEELQAANEELETSREELQSLNEELITVNAQLQGKMEEQEDTNNDLNNFLSSTNIPTIFLDHLFRVKRFTPAMSRLLKLIPADAGRPIMDMSQENLGPDLVSDAKDVLERLTPVKREITIKGEWYIRTTLPYRTLNNIIGGVVIIYNDINEIKKAQELKGRLAAIVESADDAIISKDLNGIITTWNVGAEKIFGYTADEAIGKHVSFLVPPGHADESPDILARIALGEHVEHFETVHMRKDGVIIPVSLTFSAIKDENGRIVGASKIAHDINARKRAEEELVRAKEDWERTFDTVPDLIAILDNQHHVRRVNKAMADRLGLTPEECVGLPCYKAVHGLSAPPAFCPHSRTIADGEEHIEEVHEDLLGGDFAVSTTPLLDELGRVTGSVHVAHDITERKEAERALRESESRYRELVQNANSAIIRWASDGTITFFNEYAEEFFGWSSDEVIGRHVRLLLPEQESTGADLTALVRDIVDHPERYVNNVNENVCRDGRRVWMTWTNHALRDESGEVTEVLAIGSDITALKAAEEALRESETRYHRLFEDDLTGDFISSADGQISLCNPAFAEIFGFASAIDAIGTNITDLYIDPREHKSLLERLKQQGKIDRLEAWRKRRDGRHICLVENLVGHFNEHGELVEVKGYLVDITERKQAEEALREREAEFRSLFELSAAGNAQADPITRRFLRVNRRFCEITGYSEDELLTKTFSDLTHPDDRLQDLKITVPVLEGKEDRWETEKRYVRANGDIVWVYVTGQLIRDEDSRPYRTIANILDITDRKQAEESIRRQNAILEGINLIFQKSLTCGSEKELAHACLAVIEEVTGSRFGFIGEIGADGFLHDIAISDPGWELCTIRDKTGHRKPPGNFPVRGIYGRVLTDRKSFFTNDPSSHPDSIGTPEGHPPLKAFLGVPLIHGNKTVGMIGVGNRDGGYRGEEQRFSGSVGPCCCRIPVPGPGGRRVAYNYGRTETFQ